MKKKVFVLYDDRIKPNEKIAQVSGDKSYGNIIFKQKTIQNRLEEFVLSKQYILGFYPFSDENSRRAVFNKVLSAPVSTAVLYLYSGFGVRDQQMFGILLDKLPFLNQPGRVVVHRKTAAFLFPDMERLREWEKNGSNSDGDGTMEEFPGNMFVDLSSFDEFIRYITSGFDARFFNSLEGDEYTVVKSSSNKEKIRNEYNFYYFLPGEMQHWFVQPYDYREDKDMASYTMERMHMTDLAVQYVHGALDLEEFEQILRQLFYFLKSRRTRKITEQEFRLQSESLYLKKVMGRLETLKKSPYYEKMDQMIAAGTEYSGIAAVFSRYQELYEQIHVKYSFEPLSVVSHGDLCFSNILYQRHANILRMIDPKGAGEEKDLWIDPWYDLAKLSHSICGRYDFFNSGLYQIRVDCDMRLVLHLEFQNQPYVQLFQKYLEKHRFSYPIVRLYEASLFLSMLPLHLDYPQKVFGFLLNGIEILEEVAECMKG